MNDVEAMSSDELIEHYLVRMLDKAGSMEPGDVDNQYANTLALLSIAQSLDRIEYRMMHLSRSLGVKHE